MEALLLAQAALLMLQGMMFAMIAELEFAVFQLILQLSGIVVHAPAICLAHTNCIRLMMSVNGQTQRSASVDMKRPQQPYANQPCLPRKHLHQQWKKSLNPLQVLMV